MLLQFPSIAALSILSFTSHAVALSSGHARLHRHRKLKQVTEENARLKGLVAELSLDKAVLQDVLSIKFPGQRS